MPKKSYTPPQAFETNPRPSIPLKRVKSSQIAAVGYDSTERVLALQFIARGATGEVPVPVYHYPYISPPTHHEFMASASLGTFFGTFIKGGEFKKYPAEPLPDVTSE